MQWNPDPENFLRQILMGSQTISFAKIMKLWIFAFGLYFKTSSTTRRWLQRNTEVKTVLRDGEKNYTNYAMEKTRSIISLKYNIQSRRKPLKFPKLIRFQLRISPSSRGVRSSAQVQNEAEDQYFLVLYFLIRNSTSANTKI